MRRSYVYRLKPNANQLRELGIMLETHRRLYNECLEWRKFAWDVYRVGITFNEQRSWLKHQQHLGHPYLTRINNNSGAKTIERLDMAFQAFFRRCKAGEKPGYPRFKGRDQFSSIPFCTYPNGLKLEGDRLYVQHVTARKGGRIRVILHRPIPDDAKIKTSTLKRVGDKWYVVLSLELPDPKPEPSANPPAGVDLGIKTFASVATPAPGGFEHFDIPNPKHLTAAIGSLRRASRAVSRKKKGGSNRREAVRKLRRVHEQVKNRRKDHHFKVAVDLVRRFGAVAVEGLNVKGMLAERGARTRREQRRLNRSISDAAWGLFVGTLKSRAESAGVSVVVVDPRGTTQQCSTCGTVVPKGLRDRWHHCTNCGLSLDRDQNAARNVFQRGFPGRIGPVGDTAEHHAGNRVADGPRSTPPNSDLFKHPGPKTHAKRTKKRGA